MTLSEVARADRAHPGGGPAFPAHPGRAGLRAERRPEFSLRPKVLELGYAYLAGPNPCLSAHSGKDLGCGWDYLQSEFRRSPSDRKSRGKINTVDHHHIGNGIDAPRNWLIFTGDTLLKRTQLVIITCSPIKNFIYILPVSNRRL